MKITFVRASQEDKPAFWALYQEAYKALILDQFGGWDEKEHYAAFEHKWNQGGYVKMQAGDQWVGGLWLRYLPTHHEIVDIQLRETMRNRGIGSAIIQREIQKAQHSGKPLRLSVLFKNRAYRLYQRLGFRVIGESPYQYHMEI